MRKFLIILCVLIITFMCVVPPWQEALFGSGGVGYESNGYSPIWQPPKNNHVIDYTRLTVQITPILLIGAILLLSGRKSKPISKDESEKLYFIKKDTTLETSEGNVTAPWDGVLMPRKRYNEMMERKN